MIVFCISVIVADRHFIATTLSQLIQSIHWVGRSRTVSIEFSLKAPSRFSQRTSLDASQLSTSLVSFTNSIIFKLSLFIFKEAILFLIIFYRKNNLQLSARTVSRRGYDPSLSSVRNAGEQGRIIRGDVQGCFRKFLRSEDAREEYYVWTETDCNVD